jgi:hypothetical protein
LKKFNYDLAGAANEGAVASLQKLVSSNKILFGTDFPPGGQRLGTAQTIRRGRSWMQGRHWHASQTSGNALDHSRLQRHHRSSLLETQWSLSGLLGA